MRIRPRHWIALGILIVLLLAGWIYVSRPDTARLSVDAVTGKRPDITKPRDQFYPTVKIADAVGWPAGATPTPAKGLAVAAFAQGLDHPRWLYQLPNGDILVAESNSPPREGGGITGWFMKHFMDKAGAGVPSANRITLLRDTDGDGKVDGRSVFLTGLNSPAGMALVGDQLYVADTDALLRFPYTAGETRITAKPELIVRYPGGGNHWMRNVLPVPNDKTLWVTVGSSTNIAEHGIDAEKDRANILEVDPASKTYRIYAAGLRNPNGMAINPQSGNLWTVVNERDMMGSDLAPDYMSQIELGDHFGWPWYYWGGYPDKRVQPPNPELQQYSKRPDYALGPHVAALGLTFAPGNSLGPDYANGAFVGEHGSWNRKPPSGYKVVYVPFASNGFPVYNARPRDVLTGFLNANGEAQGRPVGVIADRPGALLVADDVGNTIWRVTAAR